MSNIKDNEKIKEIRKTREEKIEAIMDENHSNLSDKIKEKLNLMPDKPGVYFMKDKTDEVIYIGKAKSLKKRVGSYFNRSAKEFKTEIMVSHICDIDYIATENEVEAIILEADLIQKRQPHYNITLKDQKSFPFIVITNEIYPRVLKVRNLVKKNKVDERFKSYCNARRDSKVDKSPEKSAQHIRNKMSHPPRQD